MPPTFNAMHNTAGIVQVYSPRQSQLGAQVAPRQGERDMETNNIFPAEPSHTEAGPGPRSTPGAGEYASFYVEIDGALIMDSGPFACADYYPETLFMQGQFNMDSESRPGPVLATDTGDYYEPNNVHRSEIDCIHRADPR